MLVAVATLAGCSDDGDTPDARTGARATETAGSAERCRDGIIVDTPGARLSQLRCTDRYAAAIVTIGETRRHIVWRRAGTRWEEIARVDPGECPQAARRIAEGLVQQLCGASTTGDARPAKAPCTVVAFQEAIKRDVDDIPVEVRARRCHGGYAHTVADVGISACPPEATAAERRECERVRRFYWKDTGGEWSIITYGERVSCAVVEALDAGFPRDLCAIRR